MTTLIIMFIVQWFVIIGGAVVMWLMWKNETKLIADKQVLFKVNDELFKKQAKDNTLWDKVMSKLLWENFNLRKALR